MLRGVAGSRVNRQASADLRCNDEYVSYAKASGADDPDAEAQPVETVEVIEPGENSQSKKRSLEERVKGLENRLKLATVALAVAALVASGASATAAWLSWATAERSLAVAESNLLASGAALGFTSSLESAGSCSDLAHPFALRMRFFNQGRIAGFVTHVSVTMVPGTQENSLGHVIAESDGPIQVDGQNEAYAYLRVNCGYFRALMTEFSDFSETTFGDSIGDEAGRWLQLNIEFATSGLHSTGVDGVRYVGLEFD